jgi:hypothetical protein
MFIEWFSGTPLKFIGERRHSITKTSHTPPRKGKKRKRTR